MHPILAKLNDLQSAIGGSPALPVATRAEARRALTEIERMLAIALRAPTCEDDRGVYLPVREAQKALLTQKRVCHTKVY